MVENPPPSNAGDAGSIPNWGTKIPHATGQLSPCATAIELMHLNERARMPKTAEPMQSGALAPQPEREHLHTTTREKPKHRNKETTHCNKKIPLGATKIPCATTKTRCSQEIRKINKLNK